MQKRRRTPAMAIGLASSIALLLSAASGTALAQRAAHAPARPVPKIAGTLTLALSEDPKTLDPAHMSLGAEDAIAANIGASLVTVDPNGKIVPWLAQSWQWSDGGKTITFILRKGITFQKSGAPLTAADIKATYERDLNPKTGSPVAAQELAGVKSIEAPNARTLIFHLASTNGSFLMNIADPGYLAPVDPVLLKKYGNAYGQHPSSVGPYEIQSWIPGQSVTLVRNPNYTWAPPFDHKGAPYIKKMVFLIIPQQSSQVAAFQSGQLSVLTVPDQQWSQYQRDPNVRFLVVDSGFEMTLNYNLNEPFFQNPKVREAINDAIDRKAIVQGAFQGHAIPAYGPYPPNLIDFDPKLPPIPYSVAKAKALLRQAGYTYNAQGQLLDKNGQPISLRLYALPTTPFPLATQVVQAELQAIGIKTTITTYELSTEIQKQQSGDYDLAIFGYSWYGADPITLMQILFNTNGGLNVFHYSDPNFDKLTDEYVASTDPKTRAALAVKVQELFRKDLPCVPLAYGQSAIAIQKRYRGVVMDNFTGQPLWDNAYEVNP